MNRYAQVPTPLLSEMDGIARVYFASRPKQTLSQTTFVDLAVDDLFREVYLNPDPLLPLGEKGMFDEHGIMPSCVVKHDGAVFLYYSGWSTGTTLPYNNYTGVAISEDGGRTFKKYSKGPILDRTPSELYSATSPHVHFENGEWYMYYCSGTEWLEINGKLEHTYDIKLARSNDGLRWEQDGTVMIPQSSRNEAITKPTVIKLGDRYHMWFCYRGSEEFRGGDDSYRIGYACASDLHEWQREDSRAGITTGEKGEWDDEMIAYPAVTRIGNDCHLFFNGNDFGRDGFGVAVLGKDE